MQTKFLQTLLVASAIFASTGATAMESKHTDEEFGSTLKRLLTHLQEEQAYLVQNGSNQKVLRENIEKLTEEKPNQDATVKEHLEKGSMRLKNLENEGRRRLRAAIETQRQLKELHDSNPTLWDEYLHANPKLGKVAEKWLETAE